jgi:hypothetical protein
MLNVPMTINYSNKDDNTMIQSINYAYSLLTSKVSVIARAL